VAGAATRREAYRLLVELADSWPDNVEGMAKEGEEAP
jgi:hypothetical protein